MYTGLYSPSQRINYHENEAVEWSAGGRALAGGLILCQAREEGFVGKESGGKDENGQRNE